MVIFFSIEIYIDFKSSKIYIEKRTWCILGYEMQKRNLFLFLTLRYIDYNIKRYYLGILLNIIIIGHRMYWSCVCSRSLFKRIRVAPDVSTFMDEGSIVVGTSKVTFELLAKFSCNKRIHTLCNLYISVNITLYETSIYCYTWHKVQ